MPEKYIHRTIEKRLLQAAGEFPALILTGPRQTGKSTLLTRLFKRHRFASLDDPALRALAIRDPEDFLGNDEPLLVDEIQYAPELLPYIKMRIDRDRGRGRRGRFILTGSQMFQLMSGVTESLAGRVALFELLGFSWEETGAAKSADVWKRILEGFYPYPHVHRVDRDVFYGSYIGTFLERDVRHIRAVEDLSTFQAFLGLLAARVGSLLNLSEISREIGLSVPTLRRWLSILESTRIVYLLRPYHRNQSKRLVKAPKVYFTDTGLLAYLLKYHDADTLSAGPLSGSFFENMVVMEFLKRKFNHGFRWDMYFCRDSNGNEVDLLLDKGREQTLIEIKTSRTHRLEHSRGIERLSPLFDGPSGYVLTLNPDKAPLGRNIQGIPWWALEETCR